MATTNDVREILELEIPAAEVVTKESLMNSDKKKKIKKPDAKIQRPEGMHRELWGLLWTDNKDLPPIIPTDTKTGYKQAKAKIGRSKVRPWKWMPFTNPARKDGTIFHHWRRVADEGKDYPFARFNKQIEVPSYSDIEYQQNLHDENWTKSETDHLFDLARQFDLRFVIMQDRWDSSKFSKRSIEDIKERYYGIVNILTRLRAPAGTEPKIKVFDADHERRRKDQLEKLFNRTTEQIEEEEYLMNELKKIEQRKKEREKKTQDLQKLITAADSNMESRKNERKATKKKIPIQQKITKEPVQETTGIKFPEFKTGGVSLRSQRMKLPASIGQKKTKALEQVLDELGIEFQRQFSELNPIPTEEIVQNFNELRQDIILLYELKLACSTCDYELQTLSHRFDTLAPGRKLDIGIQLPTEAIDPNAAGGDAKPGDSPSKVKKIAETIDVVGQGTPNRKRKAAIEQSNIMKKIKQKV